MKRSDAELLIAQCLIEPHFPEDPEAEAAYILQRLLKAGMSPPDWNYTVFGYNEGFISPPQWQPETKDE